MLEQTIICTKCKETLKCIGGESSMGELGYNEHFFCEKCKVNIDIATRFNKTGGDTSD